MPRVSEIRPAAPGDAPALRTVCALAYQDNPLMRWALPDARTRQDACAAWLGPALDRYVVTGRVDVLEVDGDVVALAAWRVPGRDVAGGPVAASLPTPAGVLGALVGPVRAAEVLDALRGTVRLAPAAAGPYLNYLAVHPSHQGRGLGGELLAHGRAGLSTVHGTVWLATSDPRNVRFYARHGFAHAGSHPLPPDGPTLTVLHAG